ncbi:cytochrome b N-terminal domain-containing protein [Anaerolineales bacterium HSG6]|nr:cytochrome b N-terminal domain-containing protein [Anaerolineales bacterium HSG6]MDM8531848.1 cytochrome b N-terminal domain-containing protein [Anaerolineales bacterium HSG25]
MSKTKKDVADSSFLQRVWESIFRGPIDPQTDRERKLMVLDSLILHLHPTTVTERVLKLTLTWGLGGMAALLTMILVFSGVMLMFNYTPSPDQAYNDILNLQTQVWFGQLMRNIHHWAGNLMVVVVVLHMLRVFFTGGFHTPKQFNWIMGLILLLLTVTANFTGYLLPWDQLAYWAITVGTGLITYVPLLGNWIQTVILGGPEVGAATLLNFYSLHIALIPIGLLAIMSIHFFRVRRDGGVVIPRAPDEVLEKRQPKMTTIPHLVVRELVVGLVMMAALLLFAMWVDAPLEGVANPDISPNPAKAPWYFMGFQELLLHFHPFVAAIILPISALLTLALLPYLDPDIDMVGVWFRSNKGRLMTFVSALVAVISTPILVIADEYLLDFVGWLPSLPTIISNGFVPLALLMLVVVGFYELMKRLFKASRCETIQTTFVFLGVAFIMLMIIGIWFRGPGMVLMWPWEVAAAVSH